MKKRIVLFTLLVMVILIGSNSVASADEVCYEINEENFPDANVRSELKRYDTDSDGIISQTTLDDITSFDAVNFDETGARGLSGIEKMPNIAYLSICDYDLNTIDIRKLGKLESLYVENCTESTKDLSKNINTRNIKGLIVRTREREGFKGIDVNAFTNLDCLVYDGGEFVNVDVSKLKKLRILNCRDNHIKSIDLRNNKRLEILKVQGNQLTHLRFPKNSSLEVLDCSKNKIKQLDMSNCKELKKIHCSNNEMTKLTLDKNKKLKTLICERNSLTKLNLSVCKKLRYILLDGSTVCNVYFAKEMKKLRTVSLQNTRIKSVDLRKIQLPTKIRFRGKGIQVKKRKETELKILKSYDYTTDRLEDTEFTYSYSYKGFGNYRVYNK